MEIFVTGATGYVGSAVCRILRSNGFEVSGLARSPKAVERLEAAEFCPCMGI